MSRRLFSIGLLLAFMVHAMSAAAQTSLRVELRVDGAADARLLERARGQTSDLPIELSAYQSKAPLGSFGAAVAQAFAQCRQSGADVVAWGIPAKRDATGKGGSSWIVALATCKDGRVFGRRIESVRPARGASDGADSGVLEAAALVLRGALGVLAQGGTLGVVPASAPEAVSAEEAEGTAAPAPASAVSTPRAPTSSVPQAASARGQTSTVLPTQRQSHHASAEANSALAASRAQARTSRASSAQLRSPHGSEKSATIADSRADAAGAERVPKRRATRAVAVLAIAGVQDAWDGASAKGQPALHAAVALGKAGFQLGVTGSFGFEIKHQDPPYVELALSRHSVAAQWRQRLWQHAEWSFSAGLDAGAVLYLRETRALDPSARSRPRSLSPAAFASPWLSLGRRLGPLWLSLAAALDLVPFAPRFVYNTPAGSREALELWPLAPRLVLAFGIGQP